ncbi:hypothetical protein GCM10007913_27450 [Devosia yakushimensis]|uniref:Uncharacterized protein n=1 Tax=Devosia yakushimensis TaxID=470028 RepID=A0ABQ5UGP6_9HYPH|nr:hypothetical protein GCM10007913_27450 [Devosia yakushimensis]
MMRRTTDLDPGLRRDDPVNGSNFALIINNHRISLGLDPRAILNPAQAASGPRIKSEGERWVA